MKFSHLNKQGNAHMVDVSTREETVREAKATGKVLMSIEVIKAISDTSTPKGDVIATARIAGIQGAKKTSELIPLCHSIALHKVEIDLFVVRDGVEIIATVKTADRTGVEMEALTAVSIAGLTLIDMIKSMDPMARIENVQLEFKSGGRNGDWER